MSTLVECVPNFSEGRDKAKVDAIIEAMKIPGVYLLDREMDADHNRCVITLAGDRENIGEAAIRGVGKAAELIDLTKHQGAHPRMGATDVVPFVPVSGVTMDECVEIARRIHYKYLRLMNLNFIESSPIPVKTSLALMGLLEPHFRLPLCPASDATRATLKTELQALGLLG